MPTRWENLSQYINSRSELCPNCEDLFSPSALATLPDGTRMCRACAIEDGFRRCRECHEWHPKEHMVSISSRSDNYYVCQGCLESYESCVRCGDMNRASDMHDVDFCGETERYCPSCADAYTNTCVRCGVRILTRRLMDGMCPKCFSELRTPKNIIDWKPPQERRDYFYSPRTHFCPAYDPDEIYYGFELEVDGHGKWLSYVNDDAAQVNNAAGYVYCKRDGSLGSRGGDDSMEIVSHPATLAYHMGKKDAWREIFHTLIERGYDSHNSGTCGLHVHVSLAAIEKKNPYAVHNTLILFDRFWEHIKRFARRTSSQLDDWAQRYSTKHMIESGIKCAAQTYQESKGHSGRYMAVNLMTGKPTRGGCTTENAPTIEFRVFRGTLNIETFCATLQLVDVLVHKAIELGDDFISVQNITWNDLVKSDYEELNAYLRRRGLTENPNEDVKHVKLSGSEDEEAVYEDSPSDDEKFSKGDKVICTIPAHDPHYPLEMEYGGQIIGKVVNACCYLSTLSNPVVIVQFDTYLPGMSDLGGIVPDGHGLYVDRSHIRKHSETVAVNERVCFAAPDGSIVNGLIVDMFGDRLLMRTDKRYPWTHNAGVTGEASRFYYITKNDLAEAASPITSPLVGLRISNCSDPRYENGGLVNPQGHVFSVGEPVKVYICPQEDRDATQYMNSHRLMFCNGIFGIVTETLCADGEQYACVKFPSPIDNIPCGWFLVSKIVPAGDPNINYGKAFVKGADLARIMGKSWMNEYAEFPVTLIRKDCESYRCVLTTLEQVTVPESLIHFATKEEV